MKLEEFQRVSKNVKTVISKFRENPGKFASIVLQMYWDMKSERDKLETQKIAYAKSYKQVLYENDLLKANNDRLIRRNQKLEAYVRMWDKVKDLRKELLEITPNHQLLIGLGLYMNELERDMYKGRE